MLTEELRARCLVCSCLVHMAAKDGDGILTAAETLKWVNVAFQPSVVHFNARRAAQNEIGRRS
jgi:hypothetical protein